MTRYKVQNEGTAAALARFWNHHFNTSMFNIDATHAPHYYEIVVVTETEIPCWREICDAFVAGRKSLVT